MVECPTCREETQLNVLGVSSLPNNLAVAIIRQVKDPEASNQAVTRKRNPRTISESVVSSKDNLSMKRQLQAGFSSLEDLETEFKNEIQELSKNIQYTIEKKIEDLVKKREGLGQQIKEILDNKLKNHEK